MTVRSHSYTEPIHHGIGNISKPKIGYETVNEY